MVCTETDTVQHTHIYWMFTENRLYRNRHNGTNSHQLNAHWEWSVQKQTQWNKLTERLLRMVWTETHTYWALTENGLYRNRHSGTNSLNAHWEWSVQKVTPTEHSLRMVCTETGSAQQAHMYWTLTQKGLYRNRHGATNTHTECSLRMVCTKTDTVEYTHRYRTLTQKGLYRNSLSATSTCALNEHWQWSIQKQSATNKRTPTEWSLTMVCKETVSVQQAHM